MYNAEIAMSEYIIRLKIVTSRLYVFICSIKSITVIFGCVLVLQVSNFMIYFFISNDIIFNVSPNIPMCTRLFLCK
jgi:hypothetical protein